MAQPHSERLSISQILAQWIASFPFDIKILLDIAGDRRLDTLRRALAIGVLSYILTPADVLPDTLRSLGLIDDVIMLRLTLAAIWEGQTDWRDLYVKMHPNIMAALDDDVAFLKQVLGIAYEGVCQLALSQVQVVYSDDLVEYLFTDATKFAARLRADPASPMRTLARFGPEDIAWLLENGLRQEARRANLLTPVPPRGDPGR
jgi:uncharacterized membrane protein YkvA (DUF1232 family)